MMLEFTVSRSVPAMLIIGLISVGGLVGCSSTPKEAPVPTLSDAELHRSGRVILAGQVTPDQLRDLQTQGVRTVVNCRRQTEIDQLSFDEAYLVDELGMTYTHLPLGGSDGYSPQDVDAFAEVLRSHTGNVLLHCSGGGRVRLLYTAYLIRHEGLSANDAKLRVQALGQGPSSLERLLGERIYYELTGESLPSEDDDTQS